jgi:hypothetical protein
MLDHTFTANANSAAAAIRSEVIAITAYSPTADWGSGTLVVQCRPQGGPDTAWIPITGATWTANAATRVNVCRDWDLRFSISGSTTPDVDCTMRAVAH